MNRWLPFTRDGRSTLVYLVLAGCGPALTLVLIWAMRTIRLWDGADAAQRLDRFADIANVISWALLVIVVALACFVSIRALKVNVRNGTAEVDGHDQEDKP